MLKINKWTVGQSEKLGGGEGGREGVCEELVYEVAMLLSL